MSVGSCASALDGVNARALAAIEAVGHAGHRDELMEDLMRRLVLVSVVLLSSLSGAQADAWKDCSQDANADRSIRGCSAFIKQGKVPNRALAAAYHNRGRAYAMKDNSERAIADYNQAIELDPQDAEYHTTRGDAYLDEGQLDRALADFNRALELDPYDTEAMTGRGEVYVEKGDLERAIADFSMAIKYEQKHGEAYAGRAAALLKAGKAADALPDAERATELEPGDADVFTTRAQVLEALGRKTEAMADYRKALSLDPSIDESKDGLKRLSASR